MTRRTCITALATAIAAGVAVDGKDLPVLKSLLEASKSEKKSVTLWVKGQTIGGQVTNLDADFVELRNREFSRIVVKLEAIDGAAMA